ncbi:MAG: YgeY family selenium metabolism-linked hydrolase [Oscillospiraceae bacterium]|nr:YgeY family selenium metabolism-linked hydrolase [Oscillospiraceae bacterium]
MDYDRIKQAAEEYRPAMTAFLRELIAQPGESSGEQTHAERILAEMQAVGFQEAAIDPQGNVIGYRGEGARIIAFDGHIDTVGIGLRDTWTFDPYEGYENDDEIGGRGGSDQLGGVVAAVYGAKIMKDLDLIPQGYRIMVAGTVQEEDCDGLCWQYIHKETGVTPEFVVSTEPTDGGVYRGQRGRMEIRVDVKGVSCHGSAPERGDNAIYKMADILRDVRELNENGDETYRRIKGLKKMLSPEFNPDWQDAQFLGRGTVTVSEIFSTSPSRCAVADSCSVSLDRRMTAGETFESCLQEIRDLPACRKYGDDVTVSMYTYDRPSWTGLVYPTECYFPTWINPESAPHVQALAQAHEALYGPERIGAPSAMENRTGRPLIDKWTFSTNGVSIQGRFGIPCVGFGPGAESQAHAPNEITWKQDLSVCAAVYAAAPTLYAEMVRPPKPGDKRLLSGAQNTVWQRILSFFKKIFRKE